MASDSDFYIFDIKHGYIPFQQYNISGSNTTVKKFSFSGFAKHLGIDPSMSPLLASLAGNDYISDRMLRPFTAHIEKLVSSSTLDAGGKKCKVVTIAQFLSRYNSISEAIHAVIGLYSNDHGSAFEKVLLPSIEEYQMKQCNLIGYFDSGDLSCNMHTYNGHLLPEWVVKLYREGLIATEGLACLCNRKIFLRTQCEDISLPSAQTCAQGLRWYYYVLALNCEDTVVPSATELPSQSKDSILSVVSHGQIELGADFDHIPTRGLTPESQVRIDNEGNNDTPSSPLAVTEQQKQLGKVGIPSMITAETELETDNDNTLPRRPITPEAQMETKCFHTSPLELQKQSEGSIPNMVTGQREFQTGSEATSYDISLSTSYSTQVKDSEYSILESEFANKLNFNENTTKSPPQSSFDHTIEDVKFGKTDDTPQATSDSVKNIDTVEGIIVTELDREGSTLAQKKVNLTREIPDLTISIHDLPKMSDQAKMDHLLSLLHSDLPFIHDLPIKHQLVVSALRYWVIHAQVKPAHLAALLVHYVGEKSDEGKFFQISLEAVHGFSQWQNVLYWVERLNALSSTFPQLQVAELYNGARVCKVYERLRVDG